MTKRLVSILICLIVLFSLCSCGENNEKNTENTTGNLSSDNKITEEASVDVDLKKVYDDCAEIMPEMLVLDADMMFDYCGIKAEYCIESYVAICANSLRTDEIWLIKVTDSDALSRISDLAEARLKAKGDESISYSPEQYEVVQNAKTIIKGDYFALLVSPDVTSLENIFNNATDIY